MIFTGGKINIQSEKKVQIFETAMTILKNNFELLPMGAFAERISKERKTIIL